MLKRLMTVAIISLFFANLAVPVAKAAGTFPVDQFPYTEMQVQVMPEFDYPENWPKDQPSLLVGYYGTFENKTGSDYSGDIEFPVPLKDKNFEVYLVAEFPAEDEPEVQRPFEIDKEKNVLTWKPTKPIKKGEKYSFVVEYYTNPYKSGSKEFAFDYTNPSEIKKLDIIMYVPLNAKNFKIDPKPTVTEDSEFGEKVHVYQYSDVKKGNNIKISVAYDKKDNESTLSLLSKKNPPKDENHSGVTATEQVTNGDNKNAAKDRPIIGMGGASVIGVSIIVAGIFVFLGFKANAGSSKQPSPKNKKAQHNVAPKTGKKDSTDHKKKLRTLLMNGQINEETYEKEMKKLG